MLFQMYDFIQHEITGSSPPRARGITVINTACESKRLRGLAKVCWLNIRIGLAARWLIEVPRKIGQTLKVYSTD